MSPTYLMCVALMTIFVINTTKLHKVSAESDAENIDEDTVDIGLPSCKLMTVNKSEIQFVKNSSNVQMKFGNFNDSLDVLEWSSETVTVCYPLSPQLLQCRHRLRPLSTHNYTVLPNRTLLLANETIGPRDYYVAPNESAVFACSDPITDRTARCNQDIYAQGEYAIEGVDNETVVLINSNVTLYRPQYKLLPNNSIEVCYPLHLDIINCKTLGVIPKKAYEIKNGHQFQRIPRGCADVPPLDPGMYLMQKPLQNVVYCTSEPQPILDLYAILTALYLVSAIFLIIAVVLHLSVPALNYHAKPLLCHMTTLMTMYLCLFSRKYMEKPGPRSCYTLFVFTYISMMGSLLWTNVQAFDLWTVFAKLNNLDCWTSTGGSQKKRFALYSTYALGVPAVLGTFTIILDNDGRLQQATGLRPGIGKFCWFYERKSSYALLYGPLFVVMLLNVILFIWTVVNLKGAGKGTQVVNKHLKRQQLAVCVRLFISMGLFFGLFMVTEAITFPFCLGPQVFYIPNILVSLQGVVVFAVHICRPNTWHLLQNTFSTKYRNNDVNTQINNE